MGDSGKPKYWEKNFFSPTVSTINPTWTGMGPNLGLCGDRSMTFILSVFLRYLGVTTY